MRCNKAFIYMCISPVNVVDKVFETLFGYGIQLRLKIVNMKSLLQIFCMEKSKN